MTSEAETTGGGIAIDSDGRVWISDTKKLIGSDIFHDPTPVAAGLGKSEGLRVRSSSTGDLIISGSASF
jgi:hypothetical protein